MIKMVDIKTINTIYTTIYKSNGTKTMVSFLKHCASSGISRSFFMSQAGDPVIVAIMGCVYCYLQFTGYFKNIIRLILTVMLELHVILTPVFSVLNLVFFPCGLVGNSGKFVDVTVKVCVG